MSQVIQIVQEIQARDYSIQGHLKNSNPAESADAGDLGDLDLAGSREIEGIQR